MSSKPCAHPTERFVELALTEAQADRLSPVVHAAAADGRNTLFVATSAPFQADDGERVWRFQVATLPATAAYRVVRLIRKLLDENLPSRLHKTQ